MESFVLPNGAMLGRKIARELAEACGAPMVVVLVLVLPQRLHPFLDQQQLQLPSTQPPDLPRPQDTGIVPVAPVDAPIYRERTANLLIATRMPCLPHQLETNTVQLSMEPPLSLKYSLVTIPSGLGLAVVHATS